MTYTVSFENKSLLWPEGDWRIVAVSQEHKSDTSTPFPHPSHPGLCSILTIFPHQSNFYNFPQREMIPLRFPPKILQPPSPPLCPCQVINRDRSLAGGQGWGNRMRQVAGARRCRDARSEILQYRMKILRCGTRTQDTGFCYSHSLTLRPGLVCQLSLPGETVIAKITK